MGTATRLAGCVCKKRPYSEQGRLVNLLQNLDPSQALMKSRGRVKISGRFWNLVLKRDCIRNLLISRELEEKKQTHPGSKPAALSPLLSPTMAIMNLADVSKAPRISSSFGEILLLISLLSSHYSPKICIYRGRVIRKLRLLESV